MDSHRQDMPEEKSEVSEDLQVYDDIETIHEEYHLIPNQEMQSLGNTRSQLLRPKFIKSLARCTLVSFLMTLLVGICVGIIATIVWWLGLNLVHCCFGLQDNWSKMPVKYQRIRLISEVVHGMLLQLWSFTCVVPVFDWTIINQLNLPIWNVLASCADAIFRLLLFVFGIYRYQWKSYVLNILFLFISFLNFARIARYYHDHYHLDCNIFLLAVKLGIQFWFGLLFLLPFNYLFVPAFTTATTLGRTIMSMSLPIFFGIPKVVVSYVIGRVDRIFSPGKAMIFTIPTHTATTLSSRLIQANSESFAQFVAISIVHGVISILDNCAFPLKAKVLRFVFRKKDQKTSPRVSRLLADETILSMLTNSACIVLGCAAVNILSYYYLRKAVTGERYNGRALLLIFIERVGSALIIEFFCNVISLKILSYAYNIPLLRVWWNRKYWIIAMLLIHMIFAVIYTPKYIDNALLAYELKTRNQTVACLGPFERF